MIVMQDRLYLIHQGPQSSNSKPMSYRRNDTTNATYDRALLSSVPDPTRAEKQEGYNVDLLDEGRDRRAPTPPDNVTSEQHGPTNGYSPGAVAIARKQQEQGQLLENGGLKPVKVPWYRTRWGVTAIVIVILLIIGAVVGGAVGGTHHSSHPHNNGNGNTNSGSNSGNTNGTGSTGNPSGNNATGAPISSSGNIPQQSIAPVVSGSASQPEASSSH